MNTRVGKRMNVVVIAGGVGGARMALGFVNRPEVNLSVVVNVGDDDWFHGLRVCPDLDTVLYTLAGVVNPKHGWGVNGDATRALSVLQRLEAPDTWMTLGDADLGLHIYRSAALSAGKSLTQVMELIALRFGLEAALLPVTDDECPTLIEGTTGTLRFQEWFVRDRGQPAVKAVVTESAKHALVTAEVQTALREADLIVFAPSNPILSIGPMLSVGNFRALLSECGATRIAVSPLIGGKAVKGPLVQLLHDLGETVSSEAIATRYDGLLDAFVIDADDEVEADWRASVRYQVVQMPTLMSDADKSRELASRILSLAEGLSA